MRQRHIKLATQEHLEHMGVKFSTEYIPYDENTTYSLEVGSGKGQFIIALAKSYPNEHFIALEIDKNVCYRIAEKKEKEQVDNLTILCSSADTLNLWIHDKSISNLYLNFSDPWPKAKHHKRRLTYPTMLTIYEKLLKDEGILQFRTDHLGLFEDSLLYIEHRFDIIDVNFNLAPSHFMTEYEEKKRSISPIYQLKGKLRHDLKDL